MNQKIACMIVAVLLILSGCSSSPKETIPAESTTPTTVETTEATVPAQTTVPATEPVETEPATEPMVTEPTETIPATEPMETVPPTEPEETQPEVTEPNPTEPKQTDPKPTEPPKPHNHSYKEKVVEPTCEEKGYTVHTCSCGESYTDSERNPLGHDMYEEVNEPGVGYEGYTYHYCSRCDYSYKDNFVDALPTATTEDIEKAIVKYINQYRAAEGSTQLTYLPGMSKVARYRSKQLTTNYAHSTADKREALAYYQYGEWIDPADFGDPDSEGYYEAKTQEAIGYASFGGTSDEIGKAFAELFHESSGHWSYVGSSDFSYTGVGVTKSGSRWYVCVMVGEVNYG